MTRLLRHFWKNWNESIMFIVGILFFVVWPTVYRWFDATAGAFDAGILHTIPTAFLVCQFILFTSWLSYRMSFPSLHKWFDRNMEFDLIDETNYDTRRKAWLAISLYVFYVAVQTIIFIALV